MALPDLMMPVTLPAFKASEHVIEAGKSRYAVVPRQGGSDRNRPVFTTVPRFLETALEVTQSQMQDFFYWHENAILVGALPFTAAVAKIGSTGFEYWSAHSLKFTAEHLDGNLHQINLSLILEGTPSDTAPVIGSLSAEVSMPLIATIDPGYAWLLAAEPLMSLDMQVIDPPLLFAEVAIGLYFEGGGPLTGVRLDAGIIIALQMTAVLLPSEAFDAEVEIDLLITFAPEVSMAAEVSVTLDASISTTTGYVAAPGDFAIDATSTSTAIALLQVRSDGSVYIRQNSGGYTFQTAWYSPITTGIGNLLWVRATHLSGDPVTGNVTSTQQLSTHRLWSLTSEDGTGDQAASLRIDISTDPDSLSIVSSFLVDISAEFT